MTDQLPYNTVCINTQCPKSNCCSLHQLYQDLSKTELTYRVLNTTLLDVDDNGCDYLHIPKQVTAARGFKRMHETIPLKAAKNMWKQFPGNICRRQFYRILSGDVQLLPEQQANILSYLDILGADTTIGFDEYEEITV